MQETDSLTTTEEKVVVVGRHFSENCLWTGAELHTYSPVRCAEALTKYRTITLSPCCNRSLKMKWYYSLSNFWPVAWLHYSMHSETPIWEYPCNYLSKNTALPFLGWFLKNGCLKLHQDASYTMPHSSRAGLLLGRWTQNCNGCSAM